MRTDLIAGRAVSGVMFGLEAEESTLRNIADHLCLSSAIDWMLAVTRQQVSDIGFAPPDLRMVRDFVP